MLDTDSLSDNVLIEWTSTTRGFLYWSGSGLTCLNSLFEHSWKPDSLSWIQKIFQPFSGEALRCRWRDPWDSALIKKWFHWRKGLPILGSENRVIEKQWEWDEWMDGIEQETSTIFQTLGGQLRCRNMLLKAASHHRWRNNSTKTVWVLHASDSLDVNSWLNSEWSTLGKKTLVH